MSWSEEVDVEYVGSLVRKRGCSLEVQQGRESSDRAKNLANELRFHREADFCKLTFFSLTSFYREDISMLVQLVARSPAQRHLTFGGNRWSTLGYNCCHYTDYSFLLHL